MTDMLDEDAPPPLDSIVEQVDAVAAVLQGRHGERSADLLLSRPSMQQHLLQQEPRPSGVDYADEDEDEQLPVASISAIACGVRTSSAAAAVAAAAAAAPPPSIRRGFFDSKPNRQRRATTAKPAAGSTQSRDKAASSSSSTTTTNTKQPPAGDTSIPLLRAAKPQTANPSSSNSGSGAFGRPAVPDIFMLPPDQMQQQRERLVGALQPTPDMLSKVTSDPVLAEGFADPEVMAAVAEVAADPGAIKKYQGNRKVMKFYSAMGHLVGSRLEELGDDAAGKQQQGKQQQGKQQQGKQQQAQQQQQHRQQIGSGLSSTRQQQQQLAVRWHE